MRPLFFGVDLRATPPQMMICFPDRPNRFIRVRIRGAFTDHDDACRVGMSELEGFTPEQLELLSESSRPMPISELFPPVAAMIEPLEQEQRYPGVLYCLACCAKLGRGDSPAIGYLTQCPGCRRRISIRFSPGLVTVTVWA